MIDVKPADFDIESLAPGDAVAVDWTAERYHADRKALTRSSLSLLPRAPAKLRDWLAGVDDGGSQNDQQRLGTWLHEAVLEPERLNALPSIPRPAIANGRAGKGTPERAAYDGWRAAMDRRDSMARAYGAAVMTAEDGVRLAGMYQALARHTEAAAFFRAPGISEATIVWREPATGLMVKVRPDRLARLGARQTFGTDLPTGLVCGDLKSTDDDEAHAFARSAWRFGYMTQAGLYSDAVEALTGEPPIWMFFAVSQEPIADGSHGVSAYVLDDEQIAKGRNIYQRKLVEAAERIASNDWTPGHRRGVNSLPM